MPAPDLALLTEAARAAGGIALRYWRRNPRVWDKGAEHGPVTEADLAVNDMLAASLRQARPDYGWLSEETPDTTDRLECERVFIIDPIDGTRAFIAGEETFAHSLAVAEKGRVIAAVVFLPAMDRLYSASLTEPAQCNRVLIRTGTTPDLESASVLTTKAALDPAHWPRGVPKFQRNFRASLAYRLCLVAEGRHDAMLTFRESWEWDIAAGSLIAARAGASVTDKEGLPLGFNATRPLANGVIAAAPALHSQIMDHLTP